MVNKFEYNPVGVCAKKMVFLIEDNKIIDANILGGCPGYSNGLSKLIIGMDIDSIISKIKDTRCGLKHTSCPDQISKALEEYKKSNS